MFQKMFLKLTRARRFRSGMIVLCAIGVIVLVATGASPLLALGTVTMEVDPPTRAAPVNGTFTVDIVADVGAEMQPTGGLGAYQFYLPFDPSFLLVSSVANADFLGSSGRSVFAEDAFCGEDPDTGGIVCSGAADPYIDNEAGQMAFAAFSLYPPSQSGPNGTGVLATVTLQAKRAGVTTLNLENALLTDTQGNAWPDAGAGRYLNVSPGKVWIVLDALFEGADYDGDGTTDIAVWSPTTGKWYIKRSNGQNWFPTWGWADNIPVPGDYDGDGTTDIAVWNPPTGKWYIKMSGGQFFFPTWGGAGNIPVPGDYDGDGKTDIAVWNPPTGKWYIKGSGGQYSFPTWGGEGCVPVPGDYDGDQITDIAVWYPPNGKWYIKGSGGQNIYVTLGGQGDIPVPGDYDGDLSIDPAVWTPSTGKWTISGSPVVYWGGITSVPVSAP